MAHPLVDQLRFARSEFVRALEGLSDEEARRRFEPMNCISWIIGHLAWHEQLYWLKAAQGTVLVPQVKELTARKGPATTPSLEDMWAAWHTVTEGADPYLDTLTTDRLQTHYEWEKGRPAFESIGTMLRRVTYHYWYHIGEAQAIRQLLGHPDLPEFVGKIGAEAPYRPEG
jgi:uncharacterized damage-inducible protein DinB